MSRPSGAVDAAAILHEGPWTHRFISANGARFHVAEAGSGPLVLLLHGFPQFWWTWRAQLKSLAAAGYRAVALDLRGYGASDKPPRGYDTATLAADVAAVIRSLGNDDAVIIGHDIGAWIAWSMPSLEPDCTRAIGVLSMAHPLTFQRALRTVPAQLYATRHQWPFQVPVRPERQLLQAEFLAQYLSRTSGTSWPSGEAEILAQYAAALRIPFVAHSALEYFRWAARSVVRTDGRTFAELIGQKITVPVLQLQGSRDRLILPGPAADSADWVLGPYRWSLLTGAGHYLPEERAGQVSEIILDWLPG